MDISTQICHLVLGVLGVLVLAAVYQFVEGGSEAKERKKLLFCVPASDLFSSDVFVVFYFALQLFHEGDQMRI